MPAATVEKFMEPKFRAVPDGDFCRYVKVFGERVVMQAVRMAVESKDTPDNSGYCTDEEFFFDPFADFSELESGSQNRSRVHASRRDLSRVNRGEMVSRRPARIDTTSLTESKCQRRRRG